MTEALIKEIKKSNQSKVFSLLQDSTININTVDKKSGKNIVQLAIQGQDQQIFEAVISRPGVNLNMTNQKGDQNILQTAIILNKQQFVEQILQKHANPNTPNSKGYNALHTAVMENLPRMVQILVNSKLEINVKCDEGSLLNLAIIHKNPEMGLWLLENQYFCTRINLEAKTKDRINCLLLATQQNYAQLVKKIIEKLKQSKLDQVQRELFTNCQDLQGDTALHIAYRNEYTAIMILLEQNAKELGVNKEIKNVKGETIADIVIKKQQSKELQIKSQIKNKEQKKQRQVEKQIEKQKEIQRLEEQERQKAENLKKMSETIKIKAIEKKKQQNQTRLKILVVLIAAIAIFYLMFQYEAQRKKSAFSTI